MYYEQLRILKHNEMYKVAGGVEYMRNYDATRKYPGYKPQDFETIAQLRIRFLLDQLEYIQTAAFKHLNKVPNFSVEDELVPASTTFNNLEHFVDKVLRKCSQFTAEEWQNGRRVLRQRIYDRFQLKKLQVSNRYVEREVDSLKLHYQF